MQKGKEREKKSHGGSTHPRSIVADSMVLSLSHLSRCLCGLDVCGCTLQSSKEGEAGPASEFLAAMQADQRAALPVSAVNGGFDAFAQRFPFLNTGSDVYKAVEYELEYPSMASCPAAAAAARNE